MTMTMAPFVVGDKVYVGNSGGELGVWGWLAALDVKTGKELWRAYSTGTDKDVKIGADFKPFYSWMKGKDLGVTTLAGRHVEDRRRRRLGLDLLRPGDQPDLLRHQQSRPARAGAAARLQPVDERRCSRATRPPAWPSGPTSSRRTTSGTTTASTRTCCST